MKRKTKDERVVTPDTEKEDGPERFRSDKEIDLWGADGFYEHQPFEPIRRVLNRRVYS